MRRHFKFFNEKRQKLIGQYCGYTPLQAARKCASKRFQLIKSNGGDINQEIIFMKETTRGSKRKYYAYKAKKIPCTPTILHLGNGQNVIYKNKIIIKKTKLPDAFDTKEKIDPCVLNAHKLNLKITDISKNIMVIEV